MSVFAICFSIDIRAAAGHWWKFPVFWLGEMRRINWIGWREKNMKSTQDLLKCIRGMFPLSHNPINRIDRSFWFSKSSLFISFLVCFFHLINDFRSLLWNRVSVRLNPITNYVRWHQRHTNLRRRKLISTKQWETIVYFHRQITERCWWLMRQLEKRNRSNCTNVSMSDWFIYFLSLSLRLRFVPRFRIIYVFAEVLFTVDDMKSIQMIIAQIELYHSQMLFLFSFLRSSRPFNDQFVS